MATDSMIMRLVGGNVASPTLTDDKISAHDFIAALRIWDSGQINKATLVAAYDLTHANDSGDLDAIKGWYETAFAASLGSAFLRELEGRIVLARDKTPDLDGQFGFAVKGVSSAGLIGGADGVHSLRDDVTPTERQFVNWAV